MALVSHRCQVCPRSAAIRLVLSRARPKANKLRDVEKLPIAGEKSKAVIWLLRAVFQV